MAIQVIEWPDGCFVPTSCAVFKFSSDSSVLNTGDLNQVNIPASILPDIQAGTTMSINSDTYTFVASGGSLFNNEINIDANITQLAINIFAAMQVNLGVTKDYTTGRSGDVVSITPKRASLQTRIRFSNLDTAQGTFIVESQADPVLLKDGYKVRMCLTCEGVIIAEIDFFPKVSLVADETDIDEINFVRNIGCFVEPYLGCPTPDIIVDNRVISAFQTSELTCDVGIQFGEHYDRSNFFGNTWQTIRFFNADVCDEVVDCHYYLGLNVLDEVCISCSQLYWLHRYIPSIGAPGNISYSITAIDATGGILAIAVMDSTTINESLIYLPIGLPQIVEKLKDSGGLSSNGEDDIASLQVLSTFSYDGTIYNHDTTIKVIDIYETINLIYKNRFNVYQGVSLHIPESRSYNTLIEYISVCLDCKKQRKAINSESFQTFTAQMIEEVCIEDETIRDFLSSDSVFLVDGDELFPVEMTSQDIQFEEDGNVSYQPITLNIYPC